MSGGANKRRQNGGLSSSYIRRRTRKDKRGNTSFVKTHHRHFRGSDGMRKTRPVSSWANLFLFFWRKEEIKDVPTPTTRKNSTRVFFCLSVCLQCLHGDRQTDHATAVAIAALAKRNPLPLPRQKEKETRRKPNTQETIRVSCIATEVTLSPFVFSFFCPPKRERLFQNVSHFVCARREWTNRLKAT